MPIIFVSLVSILIYLVYYTIVKNSDDPNYWKSRGVADSYTPKSYISNILSLLLKRESMHSKINFVYRKFAKSPYFGINILNKRILFIRDPEVMKIILIRDFSKFLNRVPAFKTKDVIASKSIFFATGDRWRFLKSTITPLFAPSKLKAMLPLMSKCIDNLELHLDQYQNCEINIEGCMQKVALDAILSTAFGIDLNSFTDKNPEVYANSVRMLDFKSIIRNFAVLCFQFSGNIVNFLNLHFSDAKALSYFKNVLDKTLKLRRESKLMRGDFLDKFDYFVKADQNVNLNFDEDDFIAQGISLVTAGTTTTAFTIAALLHEAAFHPEIQEKIRNEVNSAYEKHHDGFSYEALQEMKYLDMALLECTRKHPLQSFIIRETSEDYTLQEKELKIDKHTIIMISPTNYYADPIYFPDPDKFIPERCNGNKENSTFFEPFLAGPRNCIGKAYAMIFMKLVVARILQKYKIEKIPDAEYDIKLLNTTFVFQTTNGIWLKLTKM